MNLQFTVLSCSLYAIQIYGYTGAMLIFDELIVHCSIMLTSCYTNLWVYRSYVNLWWTYSSLFYHAHFTFSTNVCSGRLRRSGSTYHRRTAPKYYRKSRTTFQDLSLFTCLWWCTMTVITKCVPNLTHSMYFIAIHF